MDLKNTLSEYFSNMLGNVEKAIIKVIDDGENASEDAVKLEDAEVLTNLRSQMDLAFTGSRKQRDIAIAKLGESYADLEEMFSSARQFTVQFNPSTLRLRASGGGKTEIKNFADTDAIGFSYTAAPFSVHMDVDLIFNKVDPNDAFLELAPSLGTFKGAGKSLFNLLGKNSSYSVQNEVEGLIAATRCFNTCMMSFNWGKLCYSGVLQNLDTAYTVFNPKGEPVAGTVHLSMILVDEQVNERNMGKWLGAYLEAFDKKKSLAGSGASFGGSAFTNFTF